MNGYYDHHPSLLLERPVAVVAFFGQTQRRAAHHVAARTGLPLHDLDRLIEHEAGQSLWDLVRAAGETGLRQLESRLLRQALRSRPPGLIALGDGALIQPANQEVVLAEATLVYLQRDLPGTYWHLRELESREGRIWDPFLPHPLDRLELLQPAFKLRRPGYERAPQRLDLAGKTPGQVAEELGELVRKLAGQPLEGRDLDQQS